MVNHTAAEHPWALAARTGDDITGSFYRFFPDRTMPDRYERTLREVFPTFAPGNFTWLPDAEQWVWTTFNDYQWDLDWSNPDVFARDGRRHAPALAIVGVDVLRLDAVPFLWKREGTDCENLPEVHILLRTLRAVMAVARPATIFKAEAIVPPDQLIPYLGAGRSTAARVRARLPQPADGAALEQPRHRRRAAHGQLPAPGAAPSRARHRGSPTCAATTTSAGRSPTRPLAPWAGTPFAHRHFLNDFYSGDLPGSLRPRRGLPVQPRDRRRAHLRQRGVAVRDRDARSTRATRRTLDLACRRLEVLYAASPRSAGCPLLYMGDELGLRNDASYLDDPALADDNRWMHRPSMDWSVAARRSASATLEGRLFAMFQSLLADRAATPRCTAVPASRCWPPRRRRCSASYGTTPWPVGSRCSPTSDARPSSPI